MAFIRGGAFLNRTKILSRSIPQICRRWRIPFPAITMSSDTRPFASKIPAGKDPKNMTDNEWREILTSQEFNILRSKGTEYPGTGEYDKYYPTEGHFVCRGCGNPLYSAESKFSSGCGWPAFDKCYKDSIAIKRDVTHFMVRTEILCKRCDGHLGHVFEGERMTDTNERHCVNSISIKYVPGKVEKEEGKVV